jgi:hypothetical protein
MTPLIAVAILLTGFAGGILFAGFIAYGRGGPSLCMCCGKEKH